MLRKDEVYGSSDDDDDKPRCKRFCSAQSHYFIAIIVIAILLYFLVFPPSGAFSWENKLKSIERMLTEKVKWNYFKIENNVLEINFNFKFELLRQTRTSSTTFTTSSASSPWALTMNLLFSIFQAQYIFFYEKKYTKFTSFHSLRLCWNKSSNETTLC